MIKICEYRFDKTIDANLFPNFNASFINYVVTDVEEGDNIIKRTITHEDTYPTSMSFNEKKGLVEFLYGDTRNMKNFSWMFGNCINLQIVDASNFDTRNITSMSYMFYNCYNLIELNVSNFETQNVTSMEAMFYNCNLLTSLDVAHFDTRSVKIFTSMFAYCRKVNFIDVSNFSTESATHFNNMFDQCNTITSLDLSNFNTQNVLYFNNMFAGCNSLVELDLSSFDTQNAKTMYNMFNSCYTLTELDLSNFNTQNVTSMYSMFYNCRNLISLDLSNFNTQNVTLMYELFCGCNKLETVDISSFDTRNVTSMNSLFRYCHKLNTLNLSHFDTRNVTSMSYMFDQCYVLESLNISNFNTQSVTRMDGMFCQCKILPELDLSHFNTQNVTRMEYMFNNCQTISNLNLQRFNTRQVTQMNGMFESCLNLTELNLSHFNTQNVTNMERMFYNCQKLSRLNISSFETDNVTSMSSMFYNCYVLEELDVRHFKTENVTTMMQMFRDCRILTSLDLSSFNTQNVTNMERMFFNCSALETLEVHHFETSNVTTMAYMFENCKSLTSLDVSNFNTQNVTMMISMFYNCQLLTTLDVSNFDTRNVKYMNTMFCNCYALTYLDVSNFNTKNVDTTAQMFHNCHVLTKLDVSNFDLSNATSVNHMFCACRELTSLDVSNFNTVKAINLYNMFEGCYKLTSLNLSNFRTDSATNMAHMFSRCDSLEFIDVSSFNTQNVTNMNGMFHSCYALKSLDLSNFDTRSLKGMSFMFYNCRALNYLNVSSFNTSNVTDMSYAFNSLPSLKRLDLSNFDTRKVTNVIYMFNGSNSLTWLDLSNFYLTTDVSQAGMFGCSNLKYIGMLYCDLNTINLLTQTLTNSLEKEVYLIDVKPDQPSFRQRITFKSYKSNVLRTPKELTLNEMGNLCDSLTCLTSEVSRHIGQITLNGEESWSTYFESDTNISFISSIVENTINKQYDNTNLRCDKLICRGHGAWTIPNSITINTKRISVCIKKESLEKIDVDGFKQFLSKNPITLQYELETPVIESVDLETDYQENSKRYIVYTHENVTHVNASSEGLTPIAEVGYITQDDEVETVTLQGETVLLPNAKEDTPIESAILKGQTLVNLLDTEMLKDDNNINAIVGATLDKDYFINDHTAGQVQISKDNKSPLEGKLMEGKTYTLVMTVNTTDKTSDGADVYLGLDTTTHTTGTKFLDNANGVVKIKFTPSVKETPSTSSRFQIGFYNRAVVKISRKIMLLEGDYTNVDIPYFEGMQSVQMPVLKTIGKNLFDKEAFYNDWKSKVESYVYKEIVDNEEVLKVNNFFHLFADNNGFRINVEKGVPLTLRMEFKKAGTESTNAVFTIRYGDNIYKSFPMCHSDEWKTATTTFVPTRDYITICSGYNNDGYYYVKNIQLEEGSVATSYEPHKSNILTVNEEVELRGIGQDSNRVEDELDCLTGKVISLVEEVVLNGSDNGVSYSLMNTNTSDYLAISCWFDYSTYRKRIGSYLSTLPLGSGNNSDILDNPYFGGAFYGDSSVPNRYVIKIEKTKLISPDLDGFKDWLSKNPVKVQYVVGESIKTVDVTVYSSEKRIHFTYKSNEYGQANSSTVAPVFKYKMKSNNRFVIDELKKQKTYTLYYEGNPSLVTCGGEVNILLGSPQVITSGSNDQMLYFDNFVEKIQLIEGDTTSHQVPYFLGTLDSINPKIMIDNQEFNIPFTLRSSGDVKDQFNLLTGEFIQRLSNEHEILQEPIGQSISVPSFSITSRSSVSLSSSELSLLPFFSYICRSPNHYPIDIDSNQIYTIKCKKMKNGTFSVGGVSASVTGNQIISTKSTDHRLLFNGDLGVSELVVLKGDARNILTPYFLGLKSVVNPTLCLTNGASERNALKITLTLRKLSDAIKDEFDVISQAFIKRVGERAYRRGDETSSEVLTDGKVTLYPLSREEQTQHQFRWSNGQMMSFDEQTNIFTECVHLYPHIYIKIPISTLEETIRRLKLENETLQEENISTMMAITEVFEMMMYIMPSEATTINIGAPMKAQQTNEKGGFQMVEVYVTLIIKGKKTLEQVPAIIRPQVKAQLIELGVIEA